MRSQGDTRQVVRTGLFSALVLLALIVIGRGTSNVRHVPLSTAVFSRADADVSLNPIVPCVSWRVDLDL